MANIATFGTPVLDQEEPDTFEYFGVTLRLNPEFSELDYVDYMEKAKTLDTEDLGAVTATKDFLRTMVHSEDFELLWQTARKNRQGLRGLMETANKLLTVMTGRPTEAPSGSSAGQPTTPVSSKPDSSSPESPLTAMDRRVIDRKLEAGRPDLALAVLGAVEGRQLAQRPA